MEQDPKTIREQAIRDAKTNIILDAARTVFSEKGFYESRLEDIAIAAGFSKAALYNYYPDKEAIFLNLAIRDFDGLLATLEKSLLPAKGFIDNLSQIMKTLFSFFGRNYAFFLATHTFQTSCQPSLVDVKRHHEEMFNTFKSRFISLQNMFVTLISQARINGEIGSRLSDVVIADYIGAIVRGVLFQWKLAGKMGLGADEADNIIEFISNGIALQVEVKKA